MVYLLEDVELTIDKLLSITKDLDDDVPIYNSCFYPKATKEYLATRGVKDFEPITDFYDESGIFTAGFVIGGKQSGIKLKYLRGIQEHKKEYRIERDVEDGYVYAYYENIVYYKGAIVLC